MWTDRQQWPTTLSFAHPFRAEAQGQPPVLRAPIISRHHCLEVTDRIAWLRGGVLNGEADLDQRWLDGDCGA
ncbi:hypothetical protein BASA62_002467 [Batrachochytrium salamandrivorans]|nr:hypothetical protein BASA62_002467 [Batrachochytrium salamandrivorans]